MGLPEAEYHFKSAVTYGSASIEASDAYLPAGAFHKAMAEGMLELTRALMQISARLDALAGGAGPSRGTVDPGKIVGSAGGVFVAEPIRDSAPEPAPEPDAGPDPAADAELPGRGHPRPEVRHRPTD